VAKLAKIGPSIIASLLTSVIVGQDAPKPLDPGKARTNYSFAVRSGAEPFRFQVHIGSKGIVTGVSIFRGKDPIPFQSITACETPAWGLLEGDEGVDLVKAADLNFDGFLDLQLLQSLEHHTGKLGYCIYTWDRKAGLFRYAPEIPGLNPIAHPENKTITVHEDFYGVPYNDRTYRWSHGKMVLVADDGRTEGSENPKCHSTDYCMRLIKGEMVVTTEKPAQCEGLPDIGLACSDDGAAIPAKAAEGLPAWDEPAKGPDFVGTPRLQPGILYETRGPTAPLQAQADSARYNVEPDTVVHKPYR